MRRLTATLGRKYLLLVAVGVGGAALLALGALLGSSWLSGLELALSLVALIALSTSNRIEISRTRRTQEATLRAASAPGAEAADFYLTTTMSAYVDHALTRTVAAMGAELQAQTAETTAQTDALLRLRETYQSCAAPRASSTITPVALARVLEFVESARPKRCLAIDLGTSATWIAHASAAYKGEVWAIDNAYDPYDPCASPAAVTRPSAHRIETGVTIPDVLHAYLPWHELGGVGDPFDTIVVGIADEPSARGAVPVLPLLQTHLLPQGAVIVAQQHGSTDVAQAWAANPEWSVTTRGGPVSVLRRSV